MTEEKSVLDGDTSRFIASAGGFYDRYVDNIARTPSNKAAYELTEHQYNAVCGRPRFSNHESFKAAYTQYCRRQSFKLKKQRALA